MVQICSSCNEKHIHRGEVGPIASSIGGGSNGSGGRYTPSDNKSQANSEASNVRFKVCTCIDQFQMRIITIPNIY